MSGFTALQRLNLEGHTKDIDVLQHLTQLEGLTFRSITLPDLSVLKPLRRLRAFALKLGGTKDLSLLPEVGRLAYIELWMVKGLEDLTPIADVVTLEALFLQALRRVSTLPSLHKLRRLRRVHIETLKGLSDFAPLLMAPSLEQVEVIDMGHLLPEDLQPLALHPTLREATVGLGSDRKNGAVESLLKLPPSTWGGSHPALRI